jgi:3-hydroxyisobutyrate dehydrogenase
MGSNMAANLQKKGHDMLVYDANSASPGYAMLTELGATKASSLDELASEADTILSMVTACDHVRSVYSGADGLLAKCKGRARLILDCSTINPSTSMEMITLAKESGHTFIDTPVGGGVPAAKGGTLTFMVGAHEDSAEYARAKVFLDHMGSNIVPCGAPGKGGAAKLCNNLILGINMLGVAEGYRLAGKLGVDMHLFDSVVNTSSGRCWASDTYNPVPELADKYPTVPATRDYGPPSFMSELMLKDIGLALKAAEEIGLKMPMLAEAQRLYKGPVDAGHGRLCFSSVFKYSEH